MSLSFQKTSALNLTLEGSTGSFNVGAGKNGNQSLEVKFFLTHIGLDFEKGNDEAVLQHLAPVREVFDFDQLDFDEIMQRDIDDSRVSNELIPYLLDNKSRDLIKLFPPIIVVVLPIQSNQVRPESLYPAVTQSTTKLAGENYESQLTTSGKTGEEVFQFRQPVVDGNLIEHDMVRFQVNTNKTRLVTCPQFMFRAYVSLHSSC